jgi:hypothetical protein
MWLCCLHWFSFRVVHDSIVNIPWQNMHVFSPVVTLASGNDSLQCGQFMVGCFGAGGVAAMD